MSDLKANIPVKFIINDLFDDNEGGEAMTKLSAKAWAQFSKIFKIEEQTRKEHATKEILDAARCDTLTAEYLAVRLVCNPDLEAKSSDDEKTPLMWTALHGETQCLKMLVEAKANIHATGRHEKPALHNAAGRGHPECVQVLIEAGAEVEMQDHEGDTPLMLAAYYGETQCLKMLIDAKANIRARGRYETTALHYASHKGHPECVQVLIEAGAEVEAKVNEGDTPLILAAFHGETQCLKMLIDAKANIHARDDDERTALHNAAGRGHPECVQVLIEAGAEVEVQDHGGLTPLMKAAIYGETQCLKMLVEAKANTRARSRHESTALHLASREGHPAEGVQVLIEAGTEVEAKDDDGNTPLMIAAFHGNHACMALLVNHGARIWTEADNGSTPMSYALYAVSRTDIITITGEYKQAILDILLQHSPNEHGITALMVAASKGYHGAIPLLLEMGEDPELEDKDGMTALMMAMMPREREHDLNVQNKRLIIHMLRGDRTNAELNEMRRVLWFPKVPPPLDLPE